MTVVYRAMTLDVPHDPFRLGAGEAGTEALRAVSDAGIVVTADGTVLERGPYEEVRPRHRDAEVVSLHGVLLPGFVDTHVHLPQIRALGGLGRPLLDWLRDTALPAEERMATVRHAATVARETLHNLAASGTTTALVFGSHFSAAMDQFFSSAAESGLRIASGLVVGDVGLTPALHTTPDMALDEGSRLALTWHGAAGGRLAYAVTPRFAVSCTDALLAACAETAHRVPGVLFTSHVNENREEITVAAQRHPRARHYVDTYARHGLLDAPRAVLAHDVHPQDDELQALAAHRTFVAHCPTSNAALGSGIFPLKRHVDARVGVSLGSDVGAGGGFGMIKEALQAIYLQHLTQGHPELGASYDLSPVHALYLATRGGAVALDHGSTGRLEAGEPFDAVLLDARQGSDLDIALRHADDAQALLARLLTLATRTDVSSTWVAGRQVYYRPSPGPAATSAARGT